MFAYGPYQNRVKGIPTYKFCARSCAKQTKSYSEHSVLHTVLAKQNKSVQECGLEKTFLFTVLDKTG